MNKTDMLEADAPAVPQEHDLHNAIMNIQATPDKTAGVNFQLAYKMGHRDARHAAAELALASSQQRPRLTDAEIIDLAVETNLGRKLKPLGLDTGEVFYTDASYKTGALIDFARKVRGEA